MSCDSLTTRILAEFRRNIATDHTHPPVFHALKALLALVADVPVTTVRGLLECVEHFSQLMSVDSCSLTIRSGCERFQAFVASLQQSMKAENFDQLRSKAIDQLSQVLEGMGDSRERLACTGASFITNGSVIATFGHSKCVTGILQRAKARKIDFSVVLVHSSVDSHQLTLQLLSELTEAGIPVKIISEGAVLSHVQSITMFMTGAEAVCRSGGVINTVGTSQLAMLAKMFKKTFIVAAEDIKFSTLNVLDQGDVPAIGRQAMYGIEQLVADRIKKSPDKLVSFSRQLFDYTPPKYIDMIITDYKVYTPASAAEEILRIFFVP